MPNSINVSCVQCKVAATCPRRGSSPIEKSKHKYFCRIIGGYGREPINPKILNDESKLRIQTDGPCLTLAEVPTIDKETGVLSFELTKIFSQPVLHPREKVPWNINYSYPKSGGEK